MSLVNCHTILEQFARNHSCRGNDDVLVTKYSSYGLDGFLTAHGQVVMLYVLQFVVLERVLFDY